jgi:TatD DNase family protein
LYVDSHCHLSLPELAEDLDGVIERMHAAGVTTALSVCVRLEDFDRVLESSRRDPSIYASVGVHPDTTDEAQAAGQPLLEPDVQTLVRLAADPKVVAIGETGLDYFRLTEPLDWQRERFRVHIRAALACGKPLIVHTRNAADDTLRLLREEGAARVGGVMHCFTESIEVAEAALELGFHISFSGIVTFRNAGALREVAARVPLERLLIETDAPYLAPVPLRGRRNEPSFVPHVARCLADLRGVGVDLIAQATTRNFNALFLPS